MPSYLTYPPIDPGVFPDSYASARQQVLAQLNLLTQPQHYHYPCPGNTPDGQALCADSIWLGAENAHKVLVVLSGTHGVEGFVGSAIQIDHLGLIATGHLTLPADTAILFIHALTPWGYAWLRRCDANGVDLNRNGIDFSLPLPENCGYESLKNALLSSDKAQRLAAFSEFELKHDRPALEIAISGGQYTDPTGPFYGGTLPSHGRLVTETVMRHYALHERDLAVIDLHSGLGPYGYGEIICDHQPNSYGAKIAHAWYGESVTLPALGTSTSVPKTGLMDYLWHNIMTAHSCFVTLEFGTYPTNQLFDVLLQDHQLWARENNDSARLEHSKNMHQHFCPNDDAWKVMALFRARQVIAQALRGLSV